MESKSEVRQARQRPSGLVLSPVNRASHEFLARSTLAGDQNARRRAGHLTNQREDLLHGW